MSDVFIEITAIPNKSKFLGSTFRGQTTKVFSGSVGFLTVDQCFITPNFSHSINVAVIKSEKSVDAFFGISAGSGQC